MVILGEDQPKEITELVMRMHRKVAGKAVNEADVLILLRELANLDWRICYGSAFDIAEMIIAHSDQIRDMIGHDSIIDEILYKLRGEDNDAEILVINAQKLDIMLNGLHQWE